MKSIQTTTTTLVHTLRNRLRKGLLAGLIGLGSMLGAVQAQAESWNFSAALGWGVYADTNLQFSEFFNADHTIMVRFMPQYPTGYRGSIFAVKGIGGYMIGQGDYRDGSIGAKLTMIVGSAKANYTLPDKLKPGVWHHLAIVRSRNMFRLYLDGYHLAKDYMASIGDVDLAFSGTTPSGTLRLGTNDPNPATRSTQFYGLVDDVAVFKTALTSQQIFNLAWGEARLSGIETGLYTGYTFDSATPAGWPLPPVLARPVVLSQPCKRLVSYNRDSAFDALNLPLPYSQQVPLKLPFAIGQAWVVTQGYGGLTSHNGYAAFCYDFTRGDMSTHQTSQSLTKWQPLYAATGGEVTYHYDFGDQDFSDGIDNLDYPNKLHIEHAPYEVGTYMHIKSYSFEEALQEMFLLFEPFFVDTGDHIARVGNAVLPEAPINYHLHFGVTNGSSGFPVAFSNYEASDDKGYTWYHVSRGVPRQGQWIKRLY